MEKDKDLKTHKKEKAKLKLKQLELDQRLKEIKVQEIEHKHKRSVLKNSIEDINGEGLYGTPIEPRKSLASFLRNKNKSEISLVAILDRKAAILIRIATTLVSGLIVFHEYIDANVVYGHTIGSILIGGMLITLILSLLAAKPFGWIFGQVFKKEILPKHPNLEENIFYAVEPCTLEEYETAMGKVVKSQDLQLGNQIRANYMLSKNNGIKAIILDLAYVVFLLSFVVVGVIFLFGKFSM